MNNNQKTWGVLGTGAFGSALANVLTKNGHEVLMYGIAQDEIDDINSGCNRKFFNETKFANEHLISATNNLETFLNKVNTVILAVPSIAVEPLLKQVCQILGDRQIDLVNLSKGLEPKTKEFFSKYINSNFGKNISNFASIMGPSFAIEVFNQKLTMVNIVGRNLEFNQSIAKDLNNEFFYVKPYSDISGAELFSALKNVLAIGMGICSILYPGQNSHAGLLTLGTSEIYQVYKSIYPEGECTIGYHFSSIGDIFLTCSSTTSRNFTFGTQIAKLGIDQALKEQKLTIEGYDTAKTLVKLINEFNIQDIPFLRNITEILFDHKDHNLILDMFKKSI
ncbi:NAD(P)-binding domain-containing protein [Mycoplasma sp. Pen4]|uniref:NAD(P)H-dependent glycerol-3-phosphate dehydrogenase n=1 Tax=Mycoplasma sp. Pen4 TaxID=640330 RepID=UPI00165484EE|nr:NAD(P)H-dependent glycerol-3-phosphate dehydrogenase [Mycoplasma sp. Pen4]QNM93414.1 NAD(P)-binding domain-containing protein [Mycoplasma sp. Pen4]